MFILPILWALFGEGPKRAILLRLAFLPTFGAIWVSISFNLVQVLLPASLSKTLPRLEACVENYPFPFVLITAFAALNGIFLYLMKVPTALGRKMMDQLEGLRLYLETAESDRLNSGAPGITTDRFVALLPYVVALDVEKPWAHAFESALRRAHPEDADPIRRYQPGWCGGGGNWSSGSFDSAMASTVGSVSGAFAAAMPVSSGSSGFGCWRRFRRRGRGRRRGGW